MIPIPLQNKVLMVCLVLSETNTGTKCLALYDTGKDKD